MEQLLERSCRVLHITTHTGAVELARSYQRLRRAWGMLLSSDDVGYRNLAEFKLEDLRQANALVAAHLERAPYIDKTGLWLLGADGVHTNLLPSSRAPLRLTAIGAGVPRATTWGPPPPRRHRTHDLLRTLTFALRALIAGSAVAAAICVATHTDHEPPSLPVAHAAAPSEPVPPLVAPPAPAPEVEIAVVREHTGPRARSYSYAAAAWSAAGRGTGPRMRRRVVERAPGSAALRGVMNLSGGMAEADTSLDEP